MPRRPIGDFSWNPHSYKVVLDVVDKIRRGEGKEVMLLDPMRVVIEQFGKLSCPSPADDPHGLYRVVMDESGLPVIEKQVTGGGWVASFP